MIWIVSWGSFVDEIRPGVLYSSVQETYPLQQCQRYRTYVSDRFRLLSCLELLQGDACCHNLYFRRHVGLRDGPLLFYCVSILVSQHTIFLAIQQFQTIFPLFLFVLTSFLIKKFYEFLHKKFFFLYSFLSQRATFSVLYLYRNSRPLYIQLFVLILNKGKMAVNEPIFVI